MSKTLISIIIPTYNEEKYIEKCISSVFAFKKPPKIQVEIIIVDGHSKDSTREIVKSFMRRYSNVFLFDNPKTYQAAAVNIGIAESHGRWVLRLDAHSIYPDDYLSKCWDAKIQSGAENVGGVIIAHAGNKNYQGRLVHAITTHIFGVGNAGFRVGAEAGYTDTVPFGFYDKEIFKKIGLMDERLVRAQDYEFNRRLIHAGGRVWLDPKIQVNYFNQPSLFKFLKKQLLLDAPYNAYMWYLAPHAFSYRHAITGVFTLGVIVGCIASFFLSFIKIIYFSVLGVYFLLAIFSAIQQAIRNKSFVHIITLPITFFSYHFIHGLGVLKGLVLLSFKKSPVQSIKEPWDGYGYFRINFSQIKYKKGNRLNENTE